MLTRKVQIHLKRVICQAKIQILSSLHYFAWNVMFPSESGFRLFETYKQGEIIRKSRKSLIIHNFIGFNLWTLSLTTVLLSISAPTQQIILLDLLRRKSTTVMARSVLGSRSNKINPLWLLNASLWPFKANRERPRKRKVQEYTILSCSGSKLKVSATVIRSRYVTKTKVSSTKAQ